ncbi:hypothetical protein [Xanthomonas campestris]|uniref:hypothetical protein n=1 Tax=Xanthomonas campestris TaxID=339 RepID=UPI003CE70671
MSLSEVANPKAAAKLIQDFRKRYATKVCMAPGTDHDRRIVSAHTLSVESMLRKISIDGHVYAIGSSKKIARDVFPIEIQRMGLRDVSVFNGFCAMHDRDLFACLETEPFRFSPEQLFKLAYRTASKESYLKRKQVESLLLPEQYAEIHGIKEEVHLSEAAFIYQAGVVRGAEEIENLKQVLDGFLLTKQWSRLVTRAVLFPHTPSVLGTTTFQPYVDLDGRQIQDFEDLDADMSHIFMSVIPVETGGAAIFSWLDTANSAPREFYESITRGTSLTSAVIHALLDHAENVAFSHSWYEQLNNKLKEYIFSRVIKFDNGIDQIDAYRADDAAPNLGDWGKPIVTSF